MAKNKTPSFISYPPSPKISVIIAGAGDSSRLGLSYSKQFVMILDKPLLSYSFEKFLGLKNLFEIIVVTNDIKATNKIISSYLSPLVSCLTVKVVLGGKYRQDSVYRGFCVVSPDVDLVIIHDVARPLFDLKDVKKCIKKASICNAAILAVPVIDTLKKASPDNDKSNNPVVEETIKRERLYHAQTPQVISYDLLARAYKKFRSSHSSSNITTDESTMIELIGSPVYVVSGNRKNIKITYPEDLEIATSLLKEADEQRSKEPRKEKVCLK